MKLRLQNPNPNRLARLAACVMACALPIVSHADTFTVSTTADAFLATGSPANPVGNNLTGLNFGGAGTLVIAPASSTKGRFDSVIKFNTGAAVSQFNTTYSAGNWAITGLTLSLVSNFGDQGEQPNNGIFDTINAGSFGIDWLGNDSWVEGSGGGMGGTGYPNNSSVSFNSISLLYSGGSASLGTYTYTPPGDNIFLNYSLSLNGNLVADAAAGGDISLYFYAADNQINYLINSRTFAQNHPQLTLSIAPVPEPGALTLTMTALGGLLIARRFKLRS